MVGQVGFGLKDCTEAKKGRTKDLQDDLEDGRNTHIGILRVGRVDSIECVFLLRGATQDRSDLETVEAMPL